MTTSQDIAALIVSTGHRFGVITRCDIDSVSVGFNEQGRQIQIGGWGYHIDPGGYSIGCEVLQVVANHFDGIATSTVLAERTLLRLGLQSSDDFRNWFDAQDREIEEIAALAIQAVALESIDAIAISIVLRTADRLAAQAKSAAQQVGFVGQHFSLIMAGRLFYNSELLRTLFTQGVQAAFPGARPYLMREDNTITPISLTDDRRATERRNPLTIDIQQQPALDFVRLMNSEDQRVARLIEPELERIAKLIDAAAERFANGGRLFFVGAGTSGRLAVLDAVECIPTFDITSEQVAGIMAGGESALVHSIEDAEDDEAQGRREIATRNVDERDTVIGVAASGSTPFVVGAVREAQDRGALTGCVVNNAESLIAQLVQHPIVVPTGPEVIMGSTRLKAGTAQKLVLNMISTGVMMRVGRTFGNLMTDMQMTNIKLRHRASVIVAEATRLPLTEATDLLERCNGEMKTAIACHLLGLSVDEARARLEAYQGNLSRCISERK